MVSDFFLLFKSIHKMAVALGKVSDGERESDNPAAGEVPCLGDWEENWQENKAKSKKTNKNSMLFMNLWFMIIASKLHKNIDL